MNKPTIYQQACPYCGDVKLIVIRSWYELDLREIEFNKLGEVVSAYWDEHGFTAFDPHNLSQVFINTHGTQKHIYQCERGHTFRHPIMPNLAQPISTPFHELRGKQEKEEHVEE